MAATAVRAFAERGVSAGGVGGGAVAEQLVGAEAEHCGSLERL